MVHRWSVRHCTHHCILCMDPGPLGESRAHLSFAEKVEHKRVRGGINCDRAYSNSDYPVTRLGALSQRVLQNLICFSWGCATVPQCCGATIRVHTKQIRMKHSLPYHSAHIYQRVMLVGLTPLPHPMCFWQKKQQAHS